MTHRCARWRLRPMLAWLVRASLVAIVTFSAATARAEQAMIGVFHIKASEQAVDRLPPRPPSIELRSILRGAGSVPLGDGSSFGGSAEDGVGEIDVITRGATDDRTPADSLGYRFHFVDGTLPRGLKIPDSTFLGLELNETNLFLHWNDGAAWDQEPFSFRLYVIAIDWAGNESAPSDTIVAAHDGDSSERRAAMIREGRRNFGAPAVAAALVHPDLSGSRVETVFFLLGMLDEYGPRRVEVGGDQIEHFYCNEHVAAFVFRAYLQRLASEQGLDPTIRDEWSQDCLITF